MQGLCQYVIGGLITISFNPQLQKSCPRLRKKPVCKVIAKAAVKYSAWTKIVIQLYQKTFNMQLVVAPRGFYLDWVAGHSVCVHAGTLPTKHENFCWEDTHLWLLGCELAALMSSLSTALIPGK